MDDGRFVQLKGRRLPPVDAAAADVEGADPDGRPMGLAQSPPPALIFEAVD